MIQGIDVKLFIRNKIGEDPLGSPIYSEEGVIVSNVLIQPNAESDINESTVNHGKRQEYILHIPKDDIHNWEDTHVEFFGHRFRTIGAEKRYIENMIPGNWNRNIKCERYE